MAILTAHQMGSARLGIARDSSVVDAHGECWDVQNLYVADAALMPTSTGAWPLLSVLKSPRSPQNDFSMRCISLYYNKP